MKKTNLIAIAILILAASMTTITTVKADPTGIIRIIVLKSAKAKVMNLEAKATTILEPQAIFNPEVNITQSSDYLNVNTNENQSGMMFKVYDADGNEMAQSEFTGGRARVSLDELPAGSYIARTSLKSGGIVNVQKINLLK